MFYHCVQIGFAVLAECVVLPTLWLFSAQRKKKKGICIMLAENIAQLFVGRKKALNYHPSLIKPGKIEA